MHDVYHKISHNLSLNKNDALEMLKTDINSIHYYRILRRANQYARAHFDTRGLVFGQIGMDAQACPVNCKFCSLAESVFDNDNKVTKSEEDILSRVNELISAGVNEIFLMTTGAYDTEKFLEIGAKVRAIMPEGMRLVANVGDFDLEYAMRLRQTGFTGVYHICRLGEGIDTETTVEVRMQTLKTLEKAKLELYYCVEPIGPEHTNEQIVEEIFRAKDLHVSVMAVMRRIAVPNTPLFEQGEIPAHRLALICAVALLCSHPTRAMGVHEPEELSLMAGANQIYAESGVNPRDTSTDTEQNRGFSVAKARKMLKETGWE